MIKLIASDLDGTLLKEGTMDINPEIYDIIRKLKAKGIVFAAVSGREYDSIERVFAPVKDDIYFIAGNGGIISYQGEIIEKMAIPADIPKSQGVYKTIPNSTSEYFSIFSITVIPLFTCSCKIIGSSPIFSMKRATSSFTSLSCP